MMSTTFSLTSCFIANPLILLEPHRPENFYYPVIPRAKPIYQCGGQRGPRNLHYDVDDVNLYFAFLI